MNSQFCKWLVSIMVFFCLTLVASSAVAKKPVKPPPEPEPGIGGAACVETELFPAFVYEITGELFLSNAEGDCSIPIYRTDGLLMASNMSYRFLGDMVTGNGVGKIVLSERSLINRKTYAPPKIILVEFEVIDREITTTLPMTPRVLLEQPDDFSVGFGDLSPTGDKIIVSASSEHPTGYIWEFEIPQSGMVEPENWNVLFTLEDDAGIMNPLYGLSDEQERIYFQYDWPDIKLVYIQKDPGSADWSQNPVLIAEDDSLFPGSGAIGLWDYGSGLREVLAAGSWDTIKIFDIDTCAGSIPPGSGDACIVVDGIEGWGPRGISFTTFTQGPLPALLSLYDLALPNMLLSIRECNLDTLMAGSESCYRTVIEGFKDPKRDVYNLDSAD